MTTTKFRLPNLATGIPGVDLITHGGLTRGRATLVGGTAGSAKTVFAVQFVAGGALNGEPGVFVTLEERPEDIVAHARSIGFDLEPLIDSGMWTFVDATPHADGDVVTSGDYDLGGLLARIEHATQSTGATRLALDSIGALFAQIPDPDVVRRDLYRIVAAIKRFDVTAVLTSERSEDYGETGRFGIEEYVADNVILLRNALDGGHRRRTIEVLKQRGTSHQRGEYPFSVITGQGIVALPLTAIEIRKRTSDERIKTGVAELDTICSGGFFRDSMVLVSGPTGAGKTLTACHFLGGGITAGERCMAFSFEESDEQLRRNARGWGLDFRTAESERLLRIETAFPEAAGLEDHLIRMKAAIEEFQPRRIIVDSLSALERNTTVKAFREFVIGLSAYIKQQEIAGMFTVTTSDLTGGVNVTDGHISTITDSVILLRYVEIESEIRRALTVLKMRGSSHDKNVREFVINEHGLQVGDPLKLMRGFLSGDLTTASNGDGIRP